MKDRTRKLTALGFLGAGLLAGSWVHSAGAGDILVADCLGHKVNRVDANGNFLSQFVRVNGGGLVFPHNMVFGPDGNNDGREDVYVMGLQSAAVHIYDVLTGAPINGGVFATGLMNSPVDLDFGPDRNGDGVPDLYVLNNGGSNRVVWYDGITGAFEGVFIDANAGGNYNSAEFMVFGPDVTDDGVPDLYGTSAANGIVFRFNGATGQYIDQFVPHGAAGLISGRDLIFHTDGKLYIANGGGNSIVRVNGQTGLEAEVFVPAGSGGLSNPHGMTFGPDDNGDGAADLYVASQANASVILYDGVTGDLIRVLVQPGAGGLLAAASVLFLDDPTVGPVDFTAFRGFLASGTLDDVLESDDSYLCHQPGIVLNPAEAPITLYFFGILPNDSPSTLDVTIESSANTVGLGLTFSFWNYNTNSWDVVGTDTQSLNADTVRTFAGVPADHVEAGSGLVITRYEVRQVGIVFIFPWTDCVDHIFWTFS